MSDSLGANRKFDLPAAPRILVIALRRLGDVLLTTPLIRSLRQAWPDAWIDVMVFRETGAILCGNPDIDGVIESPDRPSAVETLQLAKRLWYSYDLAITTQPGDRPSFFAIIAGRRRIGMTEARAIGRIKGFFLHRHIGTRPDLHRVEETLQLAELLGIDMQPDIVAPRVEGPAQTNPAQPYAVLHAAPFFRYKEWHREGWRAVAQHLIARGFHLVATGGPTAAERTYLDDVWDGTSIQRLDGRLSWAELAVLLERARVFVGPDTSVTHLAAGVGCPTVALFGPTDPRRWGPWPKGGLHQAWDVSGTIQRRGNVRIVQNPLPGMPCRLEGCLRHVHSHSLCLDQMPLATVIAAINEALSLVPSPEREGGAVRKTPLFSASSSPPAR